MSEERRAGRLIAFEGVDGAGKSTALALVAERLKQRGVKTYLPRLGKQHASRPVRMIRELTRDRRHLELDPRAELLLYCAREAQILTELVAPALRDGHAVLIDRSLLTPIVLGQARGLPAHECERVAHLAAAGLEPDLTIVFDVHPRTSRLRKRIERIRSHSQAEGGRKGLAGSGFKERVRELYASIARAQGHALLHAERATPGELADRSLAVIDHGPRALTETASDGVPFWMVEEGPSPLGALGTLPPLVGLYFGDGLLQARELRQRHRELEPAMCAATLDPEDPLRELIAEAEPDHALRTLARRPLQGEGDLRLLLLARHPAACILALRYERGPEADALRERHANEQPDAVLTSLQGREDPAAERLRARCWAQASDRSRAESLVLCRGEAAWREREALFERDPALGLRTLRGLHGPLVQHLLERYAGDAPKTVLDALSGRADQEAHALRGALFETGREVIDSIRGLDDERSWTLRERALNLWPSTVAHSLLGLEAEPRARAMAERCRALAAGDLHVHRRLAQLDERPGWPEWARAKLDHAAFEDDGAG